MTEPTYSGRNPHKELIADLAANVPVCTRGFWQALKKLPDADSFTDLINTDAMWAASVKITPDAYSIDEEEWTIYIFEAVHSNDVSPEKMARIVDLAFALDEDYWRLILIRIDAGSCRIYDPLALYVQENRERIAGEQTEPLHQQWQRFTIEYCRERAKP